MDFRASLDQLETAARIILAPPNVVTKEERTTAENVIMTFRKARNVFSLCRYILENSQTELVIFETADVLRMNLMQDWNRLPPDEINSLSHNILRILFSNTTFSFSMKRRLSSVVALILKHQSLINHGTQRTELVEHIVTTAITATDNPLVVGCCILDAIMAEHQYAVHAEDGSLSYEMHLSAKKNFEDTDLLKIFQFCLQFLSKYQHSPKTIRDLESVLKLLEGTLCWSFSKGNLSRKIAGVIELETTPTFKPPSSWEATVIDDEFVPIFFNIHFKLRGDENFVLRSTNLLLQLVSMTRSTQATKETRVDFLKRILPPLTATLNIANKLPAEILGLGDVVRKVLLLHRANTLTEFNKFYPDILREFLSAVGVFTCSAIEQTVVEESSSTIDDRYYRECVTRLFEAWMNMLTDSDTPPKEILDPIVTNIFDTYLKAHICPPEGIRLPFLDSGDSENVDGEDDSDVNLFRDQLQAVGIFGRFILPHAVPILTHLLHYKYVTLQSKIELVANNSSNKEVLDPIYEDLHWLILIAGHIIAFDGIGETNLIPSKINEYSCSLNANPDVSAKAFENAFQLVPPPNDGNVDPIVRLISCVVLVSETERRVHSSGLGILLSPELASNVLWFMDRFCLSYFIVNEEYYTTISQCFMTTWGPGSVVAKSTQTCLLRRIKEDLLRYSGEVNVMRDAINLLLALVDTSKKSELAILSDELPAIVQLAKEVGPGNYQMPNEIYRRLVHAVISVGSYCEDQEKRETYWDQILVPLTVRLQSCSISQANKTHDEVRMEMACVLSGFIGAAMSSHSKTATPLYKRIGPVVSQCGAILDTYHNYVDIVEMCLELVIELARRSLSYLSPSDSINLYNAAMGVVKSYARHAGGRISSEKTAEEDTYNDLVTLMDMLTCLLSKDFLDLSPESISDSNAVPAVTASDVSLLGLSTILPLMNADLLQFPNLSNKYFRLVAFLSELHADKIMLLPSPMLSAIYQSVEIGLQNCASDTFGSCCEFISCMGFHIARHSQQSVESAALCKPFLKIFLEMILSQRLGREVLPSISNVMFGLISAFQDTYLELVQQLINSRSNNESRQQLHDAFQKFTAGLNFQNGGDRTSRAGLRDRLQHFIFEAKGCLN